LRFATFITSHQGFAAKVVVGFIATYVFSILSLITFLATQKQYRNAVVMLLGVVLTVAILVGETVIIFGIAISGGATG